MRLLGIDLPRVVILVAVALVVCLSAIGSRAHGSEDPCKTEGPHDAVSYLLIDRTDKFQNADGFAQSIDVVKDLVQPGERVIVGVSTGSMGSTRLLLDTMLPQKSLWVSNVKYRSLRKKFFECIDGVKQRMVSQEEQHSQSALLETLKFVRDVLMHDKATSRRLFLYSDMVQNSPSLSFFPLPKFKAEVFLKKTKSQGMLWDLSGVTVQVAGLGQSSSDKYSLELEKFWRSYFLEAKAKLEFIGPVLVK